MPTSRRARVDGLAQTKTIREGPTCVRARAWLTLLATLTRYWTSIYPSARTEIASWRSRAARIPDDQLRRHAERTLREEHLSAEGAALFATITPRAHRASGVRCLVAFQVMYDYLDTLTELPVREPLQNSRRLHRALTFVLAEQTPPQPGSYYGRDSRPADGGYLDALVGSCHAALWSLPLPRRSLPGRARPRLAAARDRARTTPR